MNTATSNPLADLVRWLGAHAGFPARRLEPRAEALLCVAALAVAEQESEEARFHVQRRDGARDSAQRAHALRRSQVHFKCDNSAKV